MIDLIGARHAFRACLSYVRVETSQQRGLFFAWTPVSKQPREQFQFESEGGTRSFHGYGTARCSLLNDRTTVYN
jgi:hypothetical protein